jgi:hypothetical protein
MHIKTIVLKMIACSDSTDESAPVVRDLKNLELKKRFDRN